MALSYSLTTVARAKVFMGISGSSYDTVLDRIVDSATDYIEKYCDRRFKQTAYTNEMYRGNGGRRLVLKQFPVSSSASFTFQYRTTITNESDWDTVDTENYFIDYTSGIVTSLFDFLDYPDHYRFSYTAGYDYDNSATFLSDAGAADLEYACWKLVNALFTQRKNSGNIQSESIGDYSVTFTSEVMIDDELKDILSRYKRMYG